MKLTDIHQTLGTYVAVNATPGTVFRLKEWAAKQPGLELKDDLHVTILYSRRQVVTPGLPSREIHVAKFESFENFDGYLVAKLNAPTILLRHNYYMDFGGTHDFPVFNPHVSLAMIGDKQVQELEPIDFDLVFANEYVEPLDISRN